MLQALRRASSLFRVRAPNRDIEADRLRVESINQAIEESLAAAEKDLSGLKRRIDDVVARAAVTSGNADDEYLTLEPADAHCQHLFDVEIKNGYRRMEALSEQIKHFRFLKTALISRFPNQKEWGNPGSLPQKAR